MPVAHATFNQLSPMLDYIILLNPAYVTLFWTLALVLDYNRNNAARSFFSLFMAVSFLVYLSHLLYFSAQYNLYRYFDSIYILASLLVYPLYHVYIRLLTVDQKFSWHQHGRYLTLPAIIFLLHITGVLILTKGQYLQFLLQISYGVGAKEATWAQYFVYYVYILFRIVFVAQVVYFLYFNFKLIGKHNNKLQEYFSDPEGRTLRWVQSFNVIIAAVSFASTLAALAGRETFAQGNVPLVFPSIVFSVLLFLLGYYGYNQRSVSYTPADDSDIYEATPLDDKQLRKLKKNLDKLFEEDKIFRKADLKIWDVSQSLGTNRSYISRLINSEYNRNFCNHVNYYRIQHAKNLSIINPQMKNEQIAELSGFGSPRSMYRAFKASNEKSIRKSSGNTNQMSAS